jgi:hypothetical protein
VTLFRKDWTPFCNIATPDQSLDFNVNIFVHELPDGSTRMLSVGQNNYLALTWAKLRITTPQCFLSIVCLDQQHKLPQGFEQSDTLATQGDERVTSETTRCAIGSRKQGHRRKA